MVDAEEELPARGRESWSDAESAQLVEGVRQGRSVAELAAAHGRSRRAVTRQLEGFVPTRVKLGGEAAVGWLRDQLARDAGYEWRGPLRARRRVYRSGEDDAELRAAWESAADLPLVASELSVSETAAHRRLVRLRLSDGEAATVQRMGCTAGGMLEARARRQLGLGVDAAGVLLVTGLPMAAGPGFSLSVCSSRDGAHAELRKLTARLRERHATGNPVGAAPQWLIGLRRLDRGASWAGSTVPGCGGGPHASAPRHGPPLRLPTEGRGMAGGRGLVPGGAGALAAAGGRP